VAETSKNSVKNSLSQIIASPQATTDTMNLDNKHPPYNADHNVDSLGNKRQGPQTLINTQQASRNNAIK